MNGADKQSGQPKSGTRKGIAECAAIVNAVSASAAEEIPACLGAAISRPCQ
jgi:hypothetical protein